MSDVNLGIPDDYRVVKCPYCGHTQSDETIPKTLFSDQEWRAHHCPECGKLFGYMQFVERIYITAGLKED